MDVGTRGCLSNEAVRAGLIEKERRELAKQPSGRRAFKAEGTISVKAPGRKWYICHVPGTLRKTKWLWRSKLEGE